MIRIATLLFAVFFITACSTRQEGANFKGSTEQRLVTYSIDHMMQNLTPEDMGIIVGQKLLLKSHFVIDNQVVKYAHQRLQAELADRFQVNFVETPEQADYRLDMFYTSLGTDRDSAGLSVPIVNLSDPEQSAIVNILAIDMYHGIAEGNFYLTELATGKVVKKGKIHSRVKSDKFSTPFFSFPISHID